MFVDFFGVVSSVGSIFIGPGRDPRYDLVKSSEVFRRDFEICDSSKDIGGESSLRLSCTTLGTRNSVNSV